MLHLHNMLVVKGYLQSPIQLFEEIQVRFMADVFGNKPPESDFHRVYRERTDPTSAFNCRRPQVCEYDNFIFGPHERWPARFKTKPDLLLCDEARWDIDVITKTRGRTVERFGSSETYFTPNTGVATEEDADKPTSIERTLAGRRLITQSPKTGLPIPIPEANITDKTMLEAALLDVTINLIHDDFAGAACLSGINWLAVTTVLFKIWRLICKIITFMAKKMNQKSWDRPVTDVLLEALKGKDVLLLTKLSDILSKFQHETVRKYGY